MNLSILAQENSAALCYDGIDNDGDGLVDCDDPDCDTALYNACTICGPDVRSFGDAIVDWSASVCLGDDAPEGVLGPPDAVIGPVGEEVYTVGPMTIDIPSFLTIAFEDNTLCNSGDSETDLHIFEWDAAIPGKLGDFYSLSLRPKNAYTREILEESGLIESDVGFFSLFIFDLETDIDIDEYLPGHACCDLTFDQVRIDNIDADNCPPVEPWPGPDIDAVCTAKALYPATFTAIPLPEGLDPFTAFGDTILRSVLRCSVDELDIGAIGPQDYFYEDGNSLEIVNLGRLGEIDIAFTDNQLMNSGDNSPDLVIVQDHRSSYNTQGLDLSIRPADQESKSKLIQAGIPFEGDEFFYLGEFSDQLYTYVDLDAFTTSLEFGALRIDAIRIKDKNPLFCPLGSYDSYTHVDAVIAFTNFPGPVGSPLCFDFLTAPVDLSKSFNPVAGVQDRVQLKWYKDSPRIKYSDEDAAVCDIKAWPKRNLIPGSNQPTGPAIQSPDTIMLVDRLKTYPDGSPRSIFKWPLLFSAQGANNSKRVDPNIRYQWQVRCACEGGQGIESPWSEVKFFNTPDFDTNSGQYIASKTLAHPDQELTIRPNPNTGSEFILSLPDEVDSPFVLELFDMTGSLVESVRVEYRHGQETIEVRPKTTLARGLYSIRVRTSDTLLISPMLVQ